MWSKASFVVVLLTSWLTLGAAQGTHLRRRIISDSEVETCYDNLPNDTEVFYSRQWWNVSVPAEFVDSSSFILNRKPFQPLEGSDTIIAGVLFSLSGGTLKLSAFFPPLYPSERRTAELLVKYQGSPIAVKNCTIRSKTGYCGFRVDNLVSNSDNTTDDYEYEVVYSPKHNATDLQYTYVGEIPLPKADPSIAALGCFGPDDTDKELDKIKLVASVKNQNPDLLLLQGDQVYGAQIGFKFLRFLFSIQELTRSTPTIVQMDDHDYGLPNLWGAEKTEEDDTGSGFYKPVCMINALQELFMGHNPDPATTATLDNGKYTYRLT
jgi:hypothetical protein